MSPAATTSGAFGSGTPAAAALDRAAPGFDGVAAAVGDPGAVEPDAVGPGWVAALHPASTTTTTPSPATAAQTPRLPGAQSRPDRDGSIGGSGRRRARPSCSLVMSATLGHAP